MPLFDLNQPPDCDGLDDAGEMCGGGVRRGIADEHGEGGHIVHGSPALGCSRLGLSGGVHGQWSSAGGVGGPVGQGKDGYGELGHLEHGHGEDGAHVHRGIDLSKYTSVID